MSQMKYPVDADSLLKVTGPEVVKVFANEVECFLTFGLQDPSRESLGRQTWWNMMQQSSQNSYQHRPWVLLSVTIMPSGDLMIPIEEEVSLRTALKSLPSTTLIVITDIPWDPLVFIGSVRRALHPVNDSKESKRSSLAQLSRFDLKHLELKWNEWLKESQLTALSKRCVFLTTLQVCAKNQNDLTIDAALFSLNTPEERRREFIWSFLMKHIPYFKHCIAWMALDPWHVLKDAEPRGTTHLTVPFTDRQFISTLVFNS